MAFITSTADANKNRQLHAWYEKITDQKFNCPAPAESELNPGNGQPILKVVDCDDPSATYRYDYKVNIYYRTRAIKSCGFYIFYPISKDHFFAFKEVFLRIRL